MAFDIPQFVLIIELLVVVIVFVLLAFVAMAVVVVVAVTATTTDEDALAVTRNKYQILSVRITSSSGNEKQSGQSALVAAAAYPLRSLRPFRHRASTAKQKTAPFS